MSVLPGFVEVSQCQCCPVLAVCSHLVAEYKLTALKMLARNGHHPDMAEKSVDVLISSPGS